MTTVEQVYASAGPDVIIPTLELTFPAWAEPVMVASSSSLRVSCWSSIAMLRLPWPAG